MLPLFDMIANAQDGRGMDLLARQFNLSRQQAELAVEALTPALSQGLKRNASDPYGIANFMNALASGQHAAYFEDAQKAFSPQGIAEGNGILGHLFGSKELSRAVAAQAAQATGIGQDVLKQMLPAIAAMVMGGLFKQGTGQMQGAGGGNPFGEILGQIMRQSGGMPGGQQPSQAAPDPFDNPFGKIMKDMFGGGAAPGPSAAPDREAQSPFGDNPFGKIFEQMMGAGGQQQEGPRARPKAPEPHERPAPDGNTRNPYDELFGNMFESGRKTRDDYQKGVESIFEQFARGMDRSR